MSLNVQTESRVAAITLNRISSFAGSLAANPTSIARKVVEAVGAGDRTRAATLVRELSCECEPGRLPVAFLERTANGLENGAWDFFSEAFAKQEFIGSAGEFLLIAPYTSRRLGNTATELSAIWAKVIPQRSLPNPYPVIRDLFGELRQPLPVVLPLNVMASAGMIANEGGEAFIVPDGWPGVKSGNGPALNNMLEQRRRFIDSGGHCIRTIFEPRSAELLTGPLRSAPKAFRIQHCEYQMHDYGHACGLGLQRKLGAEVLSSAWYRGVEEWRSDGVGFELIARLMNVERSAEMIASNLCTRFGLDAQRRGGLDCDTDVLASLLTFHYLVQAKAIQIGRDGRQLAFSDPTPEGLLRAVELMRAEAVQLTRSEMERADPHAIWRLYAIQVPRATEMLFEQYIVKPCGGIYLDLR
jgi:hypothetical protein